jgi:protein-tyrosine-phosphatase
MTEFVAKLTIEDRLRIRQAELSLEREYEGQLNAETVQRFMDESLDMLIPRARTTEWIVLLAERFTRDRLRALIRLDAADLRLNPSVLFLCVHNAGRSQMAAGWMRKLGGDRVDVFSGGSEPAASVNQAAVAAMAEVGVDISAELPQPWSDEIVRAADVIVTMGCGDACPVFPGRRYIEWELEDPAGRSVEDVRPIRDDIERRVRSLLGELSVPVDR